MTGRTMYDLAPPAETARVLFLSYDEGALWIAYKRYVKAKADCDLVGALYWGQTYEAISRIIEPLYCDLEPPSAPD